MWERIKKWIRKNNTIHFIVRVIHLAGESSPLVYRCRDYTQNDFVRNLLQILVTPYCLVKWFVRREVPGREGLAFVLIAKNEAPYIEEWINFHLKQGVSKFIIYDNESTDNLREVLQPYIEKGIVFYELLRSRRRQNDAYNIALNKYRNMFKYIGFFDADEFVFVRNNTYGGGGHCDLVTFMDDFMAANPNAGAIGVNLLYFGSSHHETKPAGGILENFTMCSGKDFGWNRFLKTISDPVKILVQTVQSPLCYRGYDFIDENGYIFTMMETQICRELHTEKIRINHYCTKSKEEFILKTKRGNADSFGMRSMDSFYEFDRNECTDTEILSLI